MEPHLEKKEEEQEEEIKLQNLNPEPLKSFSMPCYTEKTGGVQHKQMPAITCLGDAD
jgi:hypothetical protein